jgi:hypothetical protein
MVVSPRSTIHPSYSPSFVSVTNISENAATYMITSYLDTKNKFGVLLRYKFKHLLMYDKNKDTWTSLGIEFEE